MAGLAQKQDLKTEKKDPLGISDAITPGCLVLESGAFRGIYQQGVLDALLEAGINMQCTIGVSVGALNGAAYAAGMKGQAFRFVMDHLGDSRFVGFRALQENHCPIGFRFMFEQLREWDEQAMSRFFDPRRRFVTVATNMETGSAEYAERKHGKRMFGEVIASASMPYISRPVVIGGVPYLDGGCSVRVPWQWAFEEGYSKVIVVRTRSQGFRYDINPAVMAAAKARYRKYPAFADTLGKIRHQYNKQAEQLEKLAEAGKICMISPTEDTLRHLLDRDRKSLIRMYQDGYQATWKQMQMIKNYLQTE